MTETSVLIVGAGPVGQMAALLLAKHGIPSLLVERQLKRRTAPKAHAVNPRTLEICESIGLTAENVRAAGATPEDAGWVRFVSRLTGIEFGHLKYERQLDDVKSVTPYPLTNIAQPDFEALLEAQVLQTDTITLMCGCECKQLDQHDDHVTAELLHRESGETNTVRCHYVIAADGASSPIREALGVELEGLENLRGMVTIHFEADLSQLIQDRPGILYFVLDEEKMSTFIAYDQHKTWVLMHSYDPAQETLQDFGETRCKTLIQEAIGELIENLQIANIGSWNVCAQIAKIYRQGRVFLAGDAAHRFPPSGGLGLNTGIVDAQNIAWKIAAVENGQAGEALLDTYQTERQPVAQVNSQQSLTNSFKLVELISAINGPDPSQQKDHYAAVCRDPDAYPELAKAVANQKPHFDSLNLQLGYRYDSAAIIGGKADMESPESNISCYQPSYDAGAHIPHRWVEHQGQICSLLSLLAPDKFCLIAGPKGQAWIEAAKHSSLPIQTYCEGLDYHDSGEDWETRTGLPADGAVLLRPDRHICLRCESSATPSAFLEQHLDQVLSLKI
ncbi:MAG: FAD-dependent monooxygenase [Pseudomonadota bacterium]